MMTLVSLIDVAKSHALSYDIVTPKNSTVAIPPFNTTKSSPSIIFLLNFTTSQRSALLSSPSTLALLYTPSNEHFGIGPIEAMICGVPVLACNNGGPTESVIDQPAEDKTGWLREPDPIIWSRALEEIISLPPEGRKNLSERAKRRAKDYFGMDAMANGLETALVEAVEMGKVDWTYGFGLLGLWTFLLLSVVVGLISVFIAWTSLI